jgi:hypothetical protein
VVVVELLVKTAVVGGAAGAVDWSISVIDVDDAVVEVLLLKWWL